MRTDTSSALTVRGFSVIPALALLIAGCGGDAAGGGGASMTAPAPVSQTARRHGVSGEVRILIPPARKLRHRRHPAYVSPSTQSLTVTINTQTPVTFDVAVPPCTSVAGGGLSCTFTLSAPVGNDTFAVSLYDGANATGTLLGAGSQTMNVTSGGFGPSIAIVPVTGSLVVHLADANVTPRVASTTTMTVNERDPDGNTISGSYPHAIALASTNAAVTISPSQVTASGQPVTVTYSGSTMMYGGPSISASTTGAATVTSALTVATPCAPTYAPTQLYAMWDYYTSNLMGYALPFSGGGSFAGSPSYPVYMNPDPSGRIFVTQANTSNYPGNTANVVYYTAGNTSSTSVTPSNLSIYGVAVDDAGNLFVSENNNANPSVFEMAGPLPAAGSNYGAPVQVPNSPSMSYGLIFDKYCNLFVDGRTATSTTYIEVFSTTGQAGGGYGQATTTTNTSSSFTGANGMTFDSSGNLYIAGADSVQVLAPPYTGTPTTLGFTIPGSFLASLAMDTGNNLYFADYLHNTIGESSPPYASYTTLVSGTLQDAVGVAIGISPPAPPP
jgi:hypothetical protein